MHPWIDIVFGLLLVIGFWGLCALAGRFTRPDEVKEIFSTAFTLNRRSRHDH